MTVTKPLLNQFFLFCYDSATKPLLTEFGNFHHGLKSCELVQRMTLSTPWVSPGSSNPSPAPTSLTMPACNAGPMVESEEQEETTEDGIRCDRTTINVVVSTEVSGYQ